MVLKSRLVWTGVTWGSIHLSSIRTPLIQLRPLHAGWEHVVQEGVSYRIRTECQDDKYPMFCSEIFESVSRPRVFYRGTNPGDTRRIRTGNTFWDSQLFVSSNIDGAKPYGSHITTFEAKPEAKILYHGTAAFISAAKGLSRNQSLLDYSVEVLKRAIDLGYDAVHFQRQSDVGTVLINPDMFTKIG